MNDLYFNQNSIKVPLSKTYKYIYIYNNMSVKTIGKPKRIKDPPWLVATLKKKKKKKKSYNFDYHSTDDRLKGNDN